MSFISFKFTTKYELIFEIGDASYNCFPVYWLTSLMFTWWEKL